MSILLGMVLAAAFYAPAQEGSPATKYPMKRIFVSPAGTGEDGRYVINMSDGLAVTQKQFALLTGRTADVVEIDHIFHADRIKAWIFGGFSILFASITLTSSLWAGNIDSATAAGIYLGGIGLSIGSGALCALSITHIYDNEDSMFPSDPFYSLTDAARIAEGYNTRVGKGASGAGSFGE